MKKPKTIETAAGRVIFIRTPKRLSAQQMALAMGGLADDDPHWLAVNQVVDEELSAAMLEVSDPAAKNRDHAAGRVDALSTLKARLELERRKPVGEAGSEKRGARK